MVVLYAEDDPEDIEVFCEAIRTIDSKIVCQTVTDGINLFAFLENTIVLPDLIFLDINMPLMNGRDCLIRLKNSKDYQAIPVIMYTTSTRAIDRDELKRLGASDYFIKPSTFSEIYELLRDVLNTRQN